MSCTNSNILALGALDAGADVFLSCHLQHLYLFVLPPILFTGGVSHCQRFTHMLESHLGMPVQTHPDAQFAGAIGAAVIGQRQRKRA